MAGRLAARAGRSAICLALLIAHGAAAVAQGDGIAVECVDPPSAGSKVTFDLDISRQAVTGALPINWSWFTGDHVLFGYSVLINGDHHTMQSYILDRPTGTLEICDFAAGAEQACRRHQCFLARRDAGDAPVTISERPSAAAQSQWPKSD